MNLRDARWPLGGGTYGSQGWAEEETHTGFGRGAQMGTGKSCRKGLSQSSKSKDTTDRRYIPNRQVSRGRNLSGVVLVSDKYQVD